MTTFDKLTKGSGSTAKQYDPNAGEAGAEIYGRTAIGAAPIPIKVTDDGTGLGIVSVTSSGGGADTDVNIAQVGGAVVSLGQKVMANSIPAVLASDQSAIPVTDNSGSLTVDNPILSVVGGGTEAAAQRVTIASDSTGVLSVDDNGGSLTVDGTVSLGSGSNVIGHVITDTGSTTAVTGNVTVVQPTGTNLHAVTDSGSTTAVTGNVTVVQPTGTNLHAVLDTTSTTAVTQATGSNLHMVVDSGTVSTITNVVHVDDNSGSLTVDNGGTFAVQATIAAAATSIGKAEDAASANADVGVPAMAIQLATPTDLAGTDADYAMLQMSGGRLWASTKVDTALPAGSNVIGHVIADSGSTTAVTGNVTVVQGTGTNLHAVLDSGTTTVTQGTGTNLHMVVDSGTVSTITNVVHVDDNSGSLTVDNGGTFAVQATVAAGSTNIAKAEDVASADADVGVPAMAIQKATPADTAGTDGDYAMLQMSAGRLWGSVKVDTALPAGSNVIGHVIADSGSTTAVTGTVTVDTELPAAGALSDSLANPTTPMIGSAGLLWDSNTSRWVRTPGTAAGGTNISAKSGAIGSGAIASGAIASGAIASGAVASGAIASGAVASGAVASGAFASGSISAGAVAAGATSFVKLEDVASADADAGVPAMAVQKATPANTAGTDGDYEMLQISAGRLWASTLVTDMVPGTGATNLGKAEDAASANGDVGVAAMVIQKSTPADTAGTDADYSMLQMSAGRLWASTQAYGDVASAATDSGNPVKIGFVAHTANPTAATDGQRMNGSSDKLGRQVTVLNQVRDLVTNQTTTISNTTETTIFTAVASTFLDLTLLVITNSSATGTTVTIRDTTGGSAVAIFDVGPKGGIVVPFAVPFKQTSVNTNWTAQSGTSVSSLHIFVQAANNI